jgi:hypothetical protein
VAVCVLVQVHPVVEGVGSVWSMEFGSVVNTRGLTVGPRGKGCTGEGAWLSHSVWKLLVGVHPVLRVCGQRAWSMKLVRLGSTTYAVFRPLLPPPLSHRYAAALKLDDKHRLALVKESVIRNKHTGNFR